jgi:hypothetical protein
MKYILLVLVLAMRVAFAQTDTETTQKTTLGTRETATLQTQVLNQEFETIGTETYYLASVDNSGVDGYLQMAELFEGGTKFIVSMNGTLSDYRYAVVLYEGDCGPDRPEIVRLGNINNTSGDPNSSITEAEISFDTLKSGNYFMYFFAGEPDSQVLACGEVGMDANRMGR